MDYPFPDPRDKSYGEFDESDTMNVSSGQDCTGLIPASPDALDKDSWEENYNELYDFLPKAVSDGKNDGV